MDEDVSKLTDEELQQRISGEEPSTPEPTDETEETPEEPVETNEETPEAESQEESPEKAPEEQSSEERPPSRREQLRIQQLLSKYGDPTERQVPSQRQDALDYSQALDADPEVIQQLEADRQRAEQAEYNRGISEVQYMQFYNNIRFDLPLVSEKLSKLDPVDAKALDDEYLAITGYDDKTKTVRNPDIGYADFIEARIEQAERLARSMNAQTVKNVVKQAAQTGLRPDGSSAKRLNLNQDPKNMSLEELYASIGQKPPKKS